MIILWLKAYLGTLQCTVNILSSEKGACHHVDEHMQSKSLLTWEHWKMIVLSIFYHHCHLQYFLPLSPRFICLPISIGKGQATQSNSYFRHGNCLIKGITYCILHVYIIHTYQPKNLLKMLVSHEKSRRNITGSVQQCNVIPLPITDTCLLGKTTAFLAICFATYCCLQCCIPLPDRSLLFSPLIFWKSCVLINK